MLLLTRHEESSYTYPDHEISWPRKTSTQEFDTVKDAIWAATGGRPHPEIDPPVTSTVVVTKEDAQRQLAGGGQTSVVLARYSMPRGWTAIDTVTYSLSMAPHPQ